MNSELFNLPPYSMDKEEKQKMLVTTLSELSKKHIENCAEYKNMMNSIGFNGDADKLEDIPFLPVRLFKELSLMSVEKENVFKTMTSSGTTGQAVSKIFLDRETSANQQKVLSKIVSAYIGTKRVPMVIIDSPSVVKDRAMFSARGAGILGFSIFGADKIYALKDDMSLDFEALTEFAQKHQGETILFFGFTFMIWQHFIKELEQRNITFNFDKGVLFHGGGWKKLVLESVSTEEFKARIKNVSGITHVHDYYGMVEQTGSIHVECEYGYLHSSIFSDVLIRRPNDFSVADFGEKGIIETASILASSYPGHVLLTEDEGAVFGEDDCPCGRLGKYFKVFGRLKSAEIRGCSDTYGVSFSK